ncbi:MAG: hypothetical protein QOH66_3074 [Actinomycetota bacterium]|jgi:hypothetical protein|nr:hypothetical protein [Actinomycetota bacterium]MEA2590147.1 hypothetical protein [Actinomycetota bacterium]
MAGPEDLDKARDETDADKAKDYFSKIPGFEAPSFEKPAPAEEQPASDEWVPPTKASKPEAPLSEAEEYFKKIIPK